MTLIGLSVTGVITVPHLKEGDVTKLTNGIDYLGKLSIIHICEQNLYFQL